MSNSKSDFVRCETCPSGYCSCNSDALLRSLQCSNSRWQRHLSARIPHVTDLEERVDADNGDEEGLIRILFVCGSVSNKHIYEQ